MKLRPDCIRDILLNIESLPYGEILELSDLHNLLPQYTLNELDYTCLKLHEANYICISMLPKCSLPHTSDILYLTYSGHEFLEQIKSDNTWSKVKNISNHIGSNSLDIIKSIATNVLTSAIKSYMQ